MTRARRWKPSPSSARALTILQKVSDENPAVTEFRKRLFYHHDNLAILLVCRWASPPRPRPSTARRLARRSETGRRQPRRPGFRVHLARPSQSRLCPLGDGQGIGGGGGVPRGDSNLAEAGRRLSRQHPLPSLLWHIPTMPSAFSWRTTGRPAEAEALDRQGLAALQKLVDDDPKVTQYSVEHLYTLNNLGARYASSAAQPRPGKSSTAPSLSRNRRSRRTQTFRHRPGWPRYGSAG